MLNVQFPGLGIHFTINPIAFSIGAFTVRWYGVIIAAGFLLAFLYVMSSCKKFNMDQDKLIDAVIVGIIGGLLCGALVAKLRKISVPAMLDLAALGFLIGQTIGRWGNFVNQEAFGRETSLPWGMVSENTSAIASGPVHPCFLYESLWCLLGFVLLHIFSRRFRKYDGQVFLGYLIWYGVGRFFIEGLRTDSLITPVLPLRVSQVVAAVTVITAVVLMIVFRNRTSLSGCGSRKVMELNAVVDEVPEELVDDGTSTIFDQDDAHAEGGTTDSFENASEPAPETEEAPRVSPDDAADKTKE